jgi:hypothetical protein
VPGDQCVDCLVAHALAEGQREDAVEGRPVDRKTKHSGEGRRSRNQRVGGGGTEESIGESKN